MTRIKRILFIIESFSFGGCEKALIETANLLCDNGYDVSVLSLFKKSIYRGYAFNADVLFDKRVHYAYLSDNSVAWKYRLTCFLLHRCPAALYRVFVRNNYDRVVAFCEGAPTRFVAKATIKKNLKIAWLHTATELSQKGKSAEALVIEKALYQRFSKIVAVSKGVAESFVRTFPSLESKLAVAYNPINLHRIREMAYMAIDPVKPPYPLLVSVGRITWAKGYDRYLRVIKRLKERGLLFSVWIIGGGDCRPLEAFCQSTKLDCVHFWGNKTNPYPYMLMADWIVVPSYVEGLSTVLIEGLALGKATISTACCGSEEIIGNNEFGLLVGNDETSLLSGLSQALTTPELKALFENKAKLRASSFDLNTSIQTIEKLLNDGSK